MANARLAGASSVRSAEQLGERGHIMALTDTWPVIYLRGYAGDQKGVEQTVDDPFYGFNAGSTHVRVGPRGSATFYAFEGSVIRLMTDHGYSDAYSDGVQRIDDLTGVDRWRTVWIHRYYDETSQTFDRDTDPRRWSIEEAAADLARLVDEVLATTEAPMVYLVGHSTGGLIIRSLLQRYYPENGRDGARIVAKAFTYGTPHGGIHFGNPVGPSLEWLRDRFGWNNMQDFGRQRMYEYLTPGAGPGDNPPKGFDPRVLTGYPVERFFCLVGTDAADYGLPKKVVGPQSDGLVQIESAYVYGAPRAYVHRAHSGRYGIVNSESGYANLERFFFGDVRVTIALDGLGAIARRVDRNADLYHQADVTISLRALPVVLHEQTREHFCPVPLEWKEQREGEPIVLFSLFLIPEKAVDERMRYAVAIAVHRIERRDSILWSHEHLEKIPRWSDHLVVDLQTDSQLGYRAAYRWLSQSADEPSLELDLHDDGDGTSTGRVPLLRAGRDLLGAEAALLVDAGWWRVSPDVV
jgi:pimeloyl-ACP methyl ester carboxylesterase